MGSQKKDGIILDFGSKIGVENSTGTLRIEGNRANFRLFRMKDRNTSVHMKSILYWKYMWILQAIL